MCGKESFGSARTAHWRMFSLWIYNMLIIKCTIWMNLRRTRPELGTSARTGPSQQPPQEKVWESYWWKSRPKPGTSMEPGLSQQPFPEQAQDSDLHWSTNEGATTKGGGEVARAQARDLHRCRPEPGTSTRTGLIQQLFPFLPQVLSMPPGSNPWPLIFVWDYNIITVSFPSLSFLQIPPYILPLALF